MSTVPFIFASNTGNIPLSDLDANFANVKLSVDFVIQNTQANITSVGTLTALTVSGNTSVGGNLTVAGALNAAGNVTHGNIFSNGIISAVGNIAGGNINTAGRISATGNITGSNLNATSIVQTVNLNVLNTASVVGNVIAPLFVGNVSGNVSGNLVSSNSISATSAVILGNLLSGNLSASGSIIGNRLEVITLVTNKISSDDSTAITVEDSMNLRGDVEVDGGLKVFGAPVRLPKFTTAQIANLSPVNGDLIYNATLNKFQGYQNGGWANII